MVSLILDDAQQVPAADPLRVEFDDRKMGMGYDSVSMAPQFIPEIKYAVRRTPKSEAQKHLEEVLEQDTAAGVQTALDRIRERLYEAQ